MLLLKPSALGHAFLPAPDQPDRHRRARAT
jgi:hypothetical protein